VDVDLNPISYLAVSDLSSSFCFEERDDQVILKDDVVGASGLSSTCTCMDVEEWMWMWNGQKNGYRNEWESRIEFEFCHAPLLGPLALSIHVLSLVMYR